MKSGCTLSTRKARNNFNLKTITAKVPEAGDAAEKEKLGRNTNEELSLVGT